LITLALDASTYRGTVAVLDDSRVLVEASAPMRGRNAEMLMPAVNEALREAGGGRSGGGADVQRIICGAGPGSFTSLRIAASIAKGIAVGRGVALYAVSSLALIVAGNVTDGPRGARRYVAVLDALRGESYVAEFEHDAGAVRQVGGMRLVPSSDVPSLAVEGARLVGPDQPYQWYPHARGASLMLDSIVAGGPADLASWEPVYGRMAEAQVKWEAAHGRSLPL
jgi:tRNA threonylcarbamoyladenosine biosynthesis protein TsaB